MLIASAKYKSQLQTRTELHRINWSVFRCIVLKSELFSLLNHLFIIATLVNTRVQSMEVKIGFYKKNVNKNKLHQNGCQPSSFLYERTSTENLANM